MNIKARIFIVLLSILVGTSLFAYSIKGLNYVDNQFGTKVTVFHDQQQPLQFTVVSDTGHLYVVEINGVDKVDAKIPKLSTREVQAFNVEKLGKGQYRLTFLKKPGIHISVDNTAQHLSFLFTGTAKTRMALKEATALDDNLLAVKFSTSGKAYYTASSEGNHAELLIRNASLSEIDKANLPTAFKHFKGLNIRQVGDNVRLSVDADFPKVMAKVRENPDGLAFYVGEALTPAQDTAAPDNMKVGDKEQKYAFVTRTIEGGGKKFVGERIGLIDIKDIDIKDLLRYISEFAGLNLIVDQSVTGTATYRFKNIPWDQALEIILKDKGLGSELQNGVLRVATTEKFRNEEQERRKLKEEQNLSVPTQTITKPLSYAKVKDIEKIIKGNLSKRGKLMVDERTNIIIVTDIPDKIPGIVELINTLDKATTQVLIEARIVEVAKTFKRELGIQWGFTGIYDSSLGTQTGMNFPNSMSFGGVLDRTSGDIGSIGGYAVNMPAVSATSAFGLHMGNVLGSFSLDMVLSAMEDDGLGRILSRPKVVTQNNKTAEIESGARIPIQTVQNNTVTVQYINASLKLEVTPQITAEGTIIMDVHVKKEEPDWTHVIQGNPTIVTRNASTQVLVRNGGTTVIGGIFQVNDQYDHGRVPGLSRIPLLGWLFKHDLNSTTNNELLIFVTPKIVEY